MYKRQRLAVALTALTLAAISACSPASSSSTGSSAGTPTVHAPAAKTLTVAATAEPSTLDMTAGPAVAPAQVQLYNVYETLVKIDGDGALQLSLIHI